MKIIDISKDVMTSEIYEGDPVPTLTRVREIGDASDYNLSVIKMCVHNGTHMDAPLHFIPEAADITEFPPEVFFGPCAVVEVPEGIITGAYVEEYFPRNTKRVLIKTNGAAIIHESAASAMSYLGYILVGTDSLSIEPEDSDGRCHRTLMANNIAVLENLNLENVRPGDYFLSACPVKISGAEASPVRAVLVSDFIFWSGDSK